MMRMMVQVMMVMTKLGKLDLFLRTSQLVRYKSLINSKYDAYSSEVFLMNFKLFGNVVKHCFKYLIHLLNQN